ncbi:cytochrome c biogenesis protein ResB [Peptococcus simiae]|uniref:cytochrome c biogenesis protein ResB n=1 Tax=Peptococcus simiae TaxID=1643805 RepID=UPI00398168F6
MLKFISSIRLAVILIATLAGMAVSATIFDQTEVFYSTPFLVVVGLFFVNLLTCTLSLLPRVAKRLRRGVGDLPEGVGAYQASAASEEAIRAFFAKDRFAVQEERKGEALYLYGVKGRLPLLAPHVLHLAILIIIVGAVLSTFGVKATMQVAEGDIQAIPKQIAEATGLEKLAVQSFKTEYDGQGHVNNWQTAFELFGDTGKVGNGDTRVNHPYKKGGLSIYQMGYGRRFDVNFSTGSEETSGGYAFPEDQKIPLAEGYFILQAMGKEALLYMEYDKDGQMVRQEALKPGAGLNLTNGNRLDYIRPLEYTILELKYGHGVQAVFAGFILAALASFMLLLGRYTAVGVRVDPAGTVAVRLDAKGRERKRLAQNLSIKDVTKGND